jgi:DnaA family protein
MPAYQLPLQIKLSDTATFENFFAAGNQELVALLKQGTEPSVYIWSTEPAGKTHLLQAACNAPRNNPIYLPLGEFEQYSPAILEGLEQFNIICLDDVQSIAGNAVWEEALFDLYNRAREAGSHLVVSGCATPAKLSIQLADLVSRLNWGPVFHLHSLTDEQKMLALQMRADLRGFSIPDEVARYLINHYPRDMRSLFNMLDSLDDATLQAQRKLTIPFVKQYL